MQERNKDNMGWSVGIGITDACNLNCKHCYSRSGNVDYLKFEDIKRLSDTIDIESINFGTGENGLNPDFEKIVEYLASKKVKMSLTSNGYTINKVPNSILKLFNDIDVSIDYPEENKHDELRGSGVFKSAVTAIEKCKSLGIETSVVSCLMNKNKEYIEEMVKFAGRYDANLRYNIYKPVRTDCFTLTYQEFWEGIRRMFDCADVVSCSEPIVNAVIDFPQKKDAISCGKKSIRIRPDGSILPCVYFPKTELDIWALESKTDINYEIDNLFFNVLNIETIPQFCMKCEKLEICKGGCYSRRMCTYSKLEEPDPYCPKMKGEWFTLSPKWSSKKDLVHSDYLCTIILSCPRT